MAEEIERKICFSDIDGTLVHYPNAEDLAKITSEILLLPQSPTGKQGIISHATLAKVAALRRSGVAFAIVTGARTTTLLQRLPYLPASDAYVSENGGRVFYPDPHGLTACPLKEDTEWRAAHDAVAGPASQEVLPPDARQGVLWEWYRQLKADGWRLDCNSYNSAFRLLNSPGKTSAQLDATIIARPQGISCTFNLGIADFYPDTSGKKAAAVHLMRRWGGRPATSVFLCDDDNDLPLAMHVARAFLPSIGSESMEAKVRDYPDQFYVADAKHTAGTDQALDAVADYFSKAPGGAASNAAACDEPGAVAAQVAGVA